MRIFAAISIFILSLIACSTSGPPSPQASVFPAPGQPSTGAAPLPASSETAQAASSGTSPASPASSNFQIAVIVDTLSGTVTRDQAQAVITEASSFLRQFSPIPLELTDFVEDGAGGSTADMAGRYITSHPAALPNGIVIFSHGDNGQAMASGAYGYTAPAPAGFRNPFASPALGDSQIYVAVVDFSRKYMSCGYGASEQFQSPSSLDGECGGQAGTACVQNNGYSMCASAVGNLYTSTPTHYVSSMVIHGLLHNFGPGGDQDHYATPECNARMGYPAAFFDLQELEYYNGLCPFVYEDFTKSYHP